MRSGRVCHSATPAGWPRHPLRPSVPVWKSWWWAPLQASMPTRQGGSIAISSSSLARDTSGRTSADLPAAFTPCRAKRFWQDQFQRLLMGSGQGTTEPDWLITPTQLVTPIVRTSTPRQATRPQHQQQQGQRRKADAGHKGERRAPALPQPARQPTGDQHRHAAEQVEKSVAGAA
jgi:hypothetical protein